ncbi:hypothetical protein FBY23_1013 [Nocardioides sp. SLBN-35]|nr:hypothetical protein FBY23_1013 [Nocardioides sp. SLBN-35]
MAAVELLTRVPGAPESCTEAARALRRLGHALAGADHLVRQHARFPADDFAGDGADDFRQACAALGGELAGFRPGVDGLALALRRYADRLAGVQTVMRRVRRTARGHDLVVDGGAVRLPPGPNRDQRRTFRTLVPIVAAAWVVLAHAEEDLRAAVDVVDPSIRRNPLVAAYPTTAAPPTVDPTAPLPIDWPPGDPAWPPDHPSSCPDIAPTGGGTVHHTPAVSLAVPRRWATFDDPAPGVSLVAQAPAAAPSGFTPELALHTGPVDGGSSLTDWRHQAMSTLASQLDALEIEDSDVVDLDGEPVAYTRFSHRIGGADVMCDQWAWLHDGVGVTLTGSVGRAEYADYCDLFEDVAATVEIKDGVSAPVPGSARPAGARW